jgi:putative tricarboxylic transport membrane protein
MNPTSRSTRDILAGLVFIAAAAGFILFGRDLAVGSANRMGPGFFPVMLAAVLALLGALTIVSGLRGKAEAGEPIPWRPLVCLPAAIVFFGATIEGLGLGGALGGALVLAALGDPNMRLRLALPTIFAIVLFCWLVFVLALGLPAPLLGTWFGA